jgi:hypothetical protein
VPEAEKSELYGPGKPPVKLQTECRGDNKQLTMQKSMIRISNIAYLKTICCLFLFNSEQL